MNSPQIIGWDSEIWLNLIKRDIPNWESKPHQPTNPKNWWKVYRRLKKEAEDDLNQDAEKLKAAFANIKDEKEQNLAQLKTRRELPKLPGSFRQRMAHNYMSGKTGSKGANKLSLMEKIRKETRDTKNLRMAVPTKDLKKQASTITRAPKDFLEDARKPQERIVHTSPTRAAVRVSAPPMAVSRTSTTLADRSSLEKEARLRALTSGRSLPRQDASHFQSLDEPSNPRALPGMTLNEERQSIMPFQPIHETHGSQPESSANFSDHRPSTRAPIGDAGRAPRIGSPGVRSPLRPNTKRKAEPSVFLEVKRSKAISPSLDDLF